MENFSSFSRVIGNISEQEKEEILTNKSEQFNDQIFEDLEGTEKEKTPEELQIIALANLTTNKLRQKYGLENFDIPPDNIHIISKDNWTWDEGKAFYDSRLQAVAVREQEIKTTFMKRVLHEMIHFKSFSALQVTNSDDPELNNYRIGLIVHTRNGKKVYFTKLNEAVTEEITKRTMTKMSDNPLFANELQRTKDVVNNYSEVTSDSGELLFDEDILYAEVKDEEMSPSDIEEGLINIRTDSFSYGVERKNLELLINKLFEKNSNKFKNTEEIFGVFESGMMTGNILPVGRLIDGTFGQGTLRKIGELDNNSQSQKDFLLSL